MKFDPEILNVLGIADGSIPVAVMDYGTVSHGWSQPDLPFSEQKGRPFRLGALKRGQARRIEQLGRALGAVRCRRRDFESEGMAVALSLG